MGETITNIFKVVYAVGNKCICYYQNEMGGMNETEVNMGFLYAHGIFLGNSFIADSDLSGKILLETMKKL